MSFLLVLGMYATWSSMFALGKLALQYSPPLFLTGFRMLLAGALLLLFLLFFKRSSLKIERKQLLPLALLAFFSIYLTNILEFWGLQYLSSAKACFIYSLSPFFAAFFSYLHFGEKMNPRKWLGMGIGFVGCIPVFLTRTGSEEFLQVFQFFSWPTLAVAGAALASVYGWVLLRLLVKDSSFSPLMANGSSMLLGGVLALVHSFFVDIWHPFPVAQQDIGKFLEQVLLMTFISNILCYNVYGALLKRFTATFLSFAGLLSPLFASLHGWLFLQEPISWVVLFSTTVVLAGLWVVYFAELRQGYVVSSAKS